MTPPTTDLLTYLGLQPGLVALVGSRIYAMTAPQPPDEGAAMEPFITVRIAELREAEDALSEDVSLWMARYNAFCYAESLATAHAIAEQVRLALHMKNRNTPAFPFEAARFQTLSEEYDEDYGAFHIDAEFSVTFTS